MNIDLVSLLFAFRGRINRAKYWIAAAVYIAVSIVAVILGLTVGMGTIFFVCLAILYIPMIVSSIAVGLKRLHDRDKSGWWLWLFYAGPSVLSGIGKTAGDTPFVFSLAGFAISIWAFVELGCLRGTAGPNRYGPDPLAGAAA